MDPMVVGTKLDLLTRRAMIIRAPGTAQLHRVPAALLRARSLPAEQRRWIGGTSRLVPRRRSAERPIGRWATAAAHLLHTDLSTEVWNNPPAWPRWRELLPHVLAVIDADRLRVPPQRLAAELLDGAAAYLQSRGEPRTAVPLLQRACDPSTQPAWARTTASPCALRDLASGLRDDRKGRGRRDLDARRCSASALCRPTIRDPHLGEQPRADHFSLRDFEQARQLDYDTWRIRRKTLPADDPDTLTSQANLARDLYAMEGTPRR